ncbi:putative glycoprotein [Wenzhou tapeworm virus 1]|uniref:Putative glycoprotein n=1 Tax=Wenzhou tapeworm virus 1 TaxID=1923661 RepID=A0A1L3KN32_9MONO|nr:putative glycoprotein [Wenzhou tapeworm virus 1]APG78766.1 putative glycoprotein [Wenzhou tapeworm virus 1]
MRFSIVLIVALFSSVVVADLWVPKLRPVLWGDYKVGVRNLTVASPLVNISLEYLQHLGTTITSDIVGVRAVPPRKMCSLAAYVYRPVVNTCRGRVVISGSFISVDGTFIEDSTAPGVYHLCPQNAHRTIQHLGNFLDFVPTLTNITVHNKTYLCTLQTYHLQHPEHLIPEGCILSVLCNNFGIEFELADGKRVPVDDASTSGSRLLTEYLMTQGPEIRYDLSHCQTQRCIVVPPKDQRRVKRDLTWVSKGVHCGGFLVYMHCQEAVTASSVDYALDQVHKRIESISVGMTDKIAKLTSVETEFRTSVSSMVERLESRLNEDAAKLNEAFHSISRGHENIKVVQRLYREQESFIRNLMDQVIQQRVHARDIVSEIQWYSRLALSAVSASESETMRILAERDLEISSLLTAGYEFVVSSAMTQNGITIFYSMPVDYELHLAYLPYKPGLRLEMDCGIDKCDQCVSQAAESTKLTRPVRGTIEHRASVQVTPFEVGSCLRTGAPPFMIVQLPGECLNVTIHETTTIPCTGVHRGHGLSVQLPPTLLVDVNYLPEPDLSLPYFDADSGSREFAKLVTDLNQRSSEEVDALRRITASHGLKTYHDAAMSSKVARDALILGAVSMSLIIAYIIAKTIRFIMEARGRSPIVGYTNISDPNKTIVKRQEHTCYTYKLLVKDSSGQLYTRYLLVHTQLPNPMHYEASGLVCRVGDGKFEVRAAVQSTEASPCKCPEIETAFFSSYIVH